MNINVYLNSLNFFYKGKINAFGENTTIETLVYITAFLIFLFQNCNKQNIKYLYTFLELYY